MVVRVLVEESAQMVKALLAAWTARSTSPGSASKRSCCGCPVAGFQTVEVRLEAPLERSPSIQCSMIVMVVVLVSGGAPASMARVGHSWRCQRPRIVR